ncbi:MAG: SpoIID/LytB domain-containing protein [Vulcanimicrobiaceae bacterium]
MSLSRRAFLALGAAVSLLGLPAQGAQPIDADPAVESRRQRLRVLLGRGVATLSPDGGFLYDGRPYRGRFERLPDGRVVSLVDLEEYLYGVIAQEMPADWPAAALQAQAICARTYVLQRSNPQRAYDLAPTQIDQVYGGVDAEAPTATAAVQATAGLVLRFGGDFAQVAYSSCCGGHTESASAAWGGPPLPYLGGVVCPYCTASPDYRWQVALPTRVIAQAFPTRMTGLGPLQEVLVAERDPSGRAVRLALVGTQSQAFVSGDSFRARLGYDRMKSLLVLNTTQAPGMVNIEGGGLGHGVGLCQWGAYGLALRDASASGILAFYFPGTQISV